MWFYYITDFGFAITKNNDIIYLRDYNIFVSSKDTYLYILIRELCYQVIPVSYKKCLFLPYNGETFWVKSIYRLTILRYRKGNKLLCKCQFGWAF